MGLGTVHKEERCDPESNLFAFAVVLLVNWAKMEDGGELDGREQNFGVLQDSVEPEELIEYAEDDAKPAAMDYEQRPCCSSAYGSGTTSPSSCHHPTHVKAKPAAAKAVAAPRIGEGVRIFTTRKVWHFLSP